MKDNYAFKQRLTCILPNIMDSAWYNLNYKPLFLFVFKSVFQMGELEGEKKIERNKYGGRREIPVTQSSSSHPNIPYLTEAVPTTFP